MLLQINRNYIFFECITWACPEACRRSGRLSPRCDPGIARGYHSTGDGDALWWRHHWRHRWRHHSGDGTDLRSCSYESTRWHRSTHCCWVEQYQQTVFVKCLLEIQLFVIFLSGQNTHDTIISKEKNYTHNQLLSYDITNESNVSPNRRCLYGAEK